jgi:hypothetical protein
MLNRLATSTLALCLATRLKAQRFAKSNQKETLVRMGLELLAHSMPAALSSALVAN